MITIYIDTRESQLISLFKARDLDKYQASISFEVKTLDIGDIHLQYDQKNFVFERKTVNDLLASVKDGRYREQKARLLSLDNANISYIIEGDDIVSSKYDRHQSLLSGVYLHTMYRDNLHVVFTKNTNDTCTFILTLCAKIIDKPTDFVNTIESYTDCIKLKTKKIDNITPENCYIMQLAQIPSISNVIAKNIQQVYPNMRSLIEALEKTDDKLGTLCNIDKIGKEKALKILNYLSFH
jgi:ERCC4-type nuclease